MTEFFDANIVKCPYCKTKFCEQEGPMCDCLMEQQEYEAELKRQREEMEEDPDDPLLPYKYRMNIRGYK